MVELVVLEILAIEWLKGAQPDGESDARDMGDTIQDLRGEMQSRGWRGGGASFAREDGLIAVAIFRAVLALDVRGQARAWAAYCDVQER